MMGGNSKHMQTSHQLVLGMVCSPLRVVRALFRGAGAANRVTIISLVFCALQRHQRGAGWGGLGGGHLDNVIIKSARAKNRLTLSDLAGPVNQSSRHY